MTPLIRICVFCCVLSGLRAQNLLPNGNFELVTDLVYEDPASAISYLDFWYPANFFPTDPQNGGTPDLFDQENPWPSSNPANFWNVVFGAARGRYHVGFANFFNNEGYRSPEALATPLIESLAANAYYHIELSVRNKGVASILGAEPQFCVDDPQKEVLIHLDSDPVFVTIDRNEEESFTDVAQSVRLQSEELDMQRPGDWIRLGTCFQANGGEAFLGITSSTGDFTVSAPCMLNTPTLEPFYIYYFDVDDIILTRLPTSLFFEEMICEGVANQIDIAALAALPLMQNEISYVWPDGEVNAVNTISEAGTYIIDANLDCITIPITLEVKDANCEPAVYVPNAFSPNADGVNDFLQAFLAVELPVTAFEFSVFDRWGGQVFSTNDPNMRWDGDFRGRPLSPGMYIWSLQYTLEDIEGGQSSYQEGGEVMILR